MATGASPTLLETSAAVAFLVADHKHNDATFEALAPRQLGLAGHAAFETFSVLVAATALEHELPLATRDKRALDTYRTLDVTIELLH